MRKVLTILMALLLLPSFALAQEVDLVWQGDTYTPPFYDGGSWWTKQSRVILLAIPHIPGTTNAKNLNYRWSKNGSVLANISGIGRTSFTFTDEILGKPQTFKVDIMSSDGAVLASRSLSLTPTSPLILIYENSPIYGVLFNREVGSSYSLREQEVTFSAFPLYFNIGSRLLDNLSYAWKTDGLATENLPNATYRTPEGRSGSSQISASIQHEDYIIQSASKNFLAQFSNE